MALKKQVLVERNLANDLPPFGVERPGATATVNDVLRTYRPVGRGAGGVADASLVSMKYMDAHLTAFFASDPVEKMVPDDLYAYQAHRRKEDAAESTVAKELRHFDAAAKAALVNGRIERHPFAMLDRQSRARLMPAPTPKGEEMTDADFDAAFVLLPMKYRGVVFFIRVTGWPRGDVCRLTRGQIQRDRIVIERPGKKRPPFMIPLEIVKDILPPPRVDTKLVFADDDGGSLYGGVYDAWVDACRKAKVPPKTLHEMGKHSWVTRAADEEVPLDDIGAAQSTNPATLRRWYLHGRERRAAKAFGTMAAARAKRSQVGHAEEHS
jgi:integrase